MNDTQTYQLLSAKALGKLLSLSARSVWRLRSARKLPEPVRVGGAIRWRLSDIELFLVCNCNMDEFKAQKDAHK